MSGIESLNKYFVYISGENIEISKAEVEVLLAIYDLRSNISWNGRVGFINTNSNPVPFLLKRAAFLREAGPILGQFDMANDSFCDFDCDHLMSYLGGNDSFCIRILSLSKREKRDRIVDLIARIGSIIKSTTNARVSLDNPDVRFLVIIESGTCTICISRVSELRVLLRERMPGKKAFFHPTIMNSFLARVMCNLGGVMPEKVVIDPFCGCGGILSEVSLIGAKAIGMDLNWTLLKGAGINLSEVSDYSSCLMQGDAHSIPIGVCDCIITDPPYGRASSTRGSISTMLVDSLLCQTSELLRNGGRMCICSASDMKIPHLLDQHGFQPEHILRMRVHSGLVREIITLKF